MTSKARHNALLLTSILVCATLLALPPADAGCAVYVNYYGPKPGTEHDEDLVRAAANPCDYATDELGVPEDLLPRSPDPPAPSNPNKPPGKATITGPATATTGSAPSYTAQASDPEGDPVKYQFTWGDPDVPDSWTPWRSSGTSASQDVSWTEPGTKVVKVRARDTHGAYGDWGEQSVRVTSRPPSSPDKPNGPGSGQIGYEDTYSTWATDPDVDRIRYHFDWGDGTTTTTGLFDSAQTAKAAHTWLLPGTYAVRVQAEDEHGESGPWSPPHQVVMHELDADDARAAANELLGTREGGTLFMDEFEATFLSTTKWPTRAGVKTSGDCGSANGNRALVFYGTGNRNAATALLDATHGDRVSFSLRHGTGTGGGACDMPEPEHNDHLALEYSIDGGTTWTTINTYLAGSHGTWSAVSEAVPELAKTPATKFRWHQLNHAGQTTRDHWAIDDVHISQHATPGLEDNSQFLCQQPTTPLEVREGLDCAAQGVLDRLPPNWLDDFEVVQTMSSPSIANHDWDGDGIPDALDSVNLPSEAQSTLAAGDDITLPQGLGIHGFLLLVEPGHREAYLITADLQSSATQATTASSALAWMEDTHGINGRNALARVLHEDITVHMQAILPDTPLVDEPLPWNTGLPVDGTWLMLRSDATRGVELSLGGLLAPIAPALASQPAGIELNPRWEFLNLHQGASFCYDDLMHTGISSCIGNSDPGWIRAYSGQAAYALEALEAALHMGLVDFGTLPLDRLISEAESLPQSVTGSLGVGLSSEHTPIPTDHAQDQQRTAPFRLPQSPALHSAFDPESPWRVMGEQSREFPHGLGVDYLFDLNGLRPGQPLVSQAHSLENPASPEILRQFHFQGGYMHIPAQPTNMRHIAIGIEATDGNHAGQAFIIDGRALDALLDLEGFEPIVDIDEEHEEGFRYDVRDVDGDGHDDVLAWIPHFSQSWIRVASSQPCSLARFWDVEIVGQDRAWLSSNCGKVFEYKLDANGNAELNGYAIPGVSPGQQAYGLHLLGPREFYVVGAGDCSGGTNNPAFIAYFRDNAFQSVEWVGSKCDTLYDIWMNPSRTRGFAAGAGPMLDFTGATWQSTTAPGRPAWECDVLDIQYNPQGQGYLALGHPECQSANPVSSIMYFDGTSFSTRNVDGDPSLYDVRDDGGAWATGIPASSSKPGIYRQSGSSWNQVSGAPAYRFFGVAEMPGSDTTWFVGSDSGNDAYIVKHTGYSMRTPGSDFTVTTSLPATSILNDLELLDKRFGLAVGHGTVLAFQGNVPPVAVGSLSSSSVMTQQSVSGTSTSYDPDGDPLSITWSWGDGASSGTASHKYNNPGSYQVRLTATDSYGDSSARTFTVSVSPEAISLGSSDTTTFSGSDAQRHHYRVLSSNGKVVEAKLVSCPSSMGLLGRTGAAVSASSSMTSWPAPESGVSTSSKLAGAVSGGDLYVAVEKPEGLSSASCTLSVKQVAKPGTPVITSLPSPTGTPVQLQATAGHADGYDARVEVQWTSGGSWYPSSLEPPGTVHTLSRASLEGGTHTVQVRSVDEFGQVSASTASGSVTVRDAPSVWASGATSIQDNRATLQGSVTDKGGDSTVTARYRLYHDGSLVASQTYLGFSGSQLPSYTVTGLQAGTWYMYEVEAENEAFKNVQSRKFQTLSTTSTLPTFTSAPASTSAGSLVSFSFKPDRSESQDVAYHVLWGDGSSTRVPASGYTSSTSTSSASHTYGLPYGEVQVMVQLETQSGGRSATIQHDLAVGGSSPVAWVTHSSQESNAVLQGQLASIVEDGSTKARFKYLDGTTWQVSPWYTALGDNSNFGPWTTPSLTYSSAYDVVVELQATAGGSWISSQSWRVESNRVPALSVLDSAPRSATYLDSVTFRVLYQDGDGDAPAYVRVEVDGRVLDMHPATGQADYRAGVEYSYTLSGEDLGAPGRYVPEFTASDGRAHRAATSVTGGRVTVTQASVATHTFENDVVGGVPAGFTKSNEPLNYWRVVDTDEAGFPDLVALGGNGKAAWFGRSPQGTYEDPNGGTPRGSLVTVEYDLSTVEKPVLSFSSYYETEDLSNTRDRKLVYVNVKDPGDSSWDLRDRLLYEVKGEEGGYKKWHTQVVDLSAYNGKVVQLMFRFDARNNQDNAHVGWFIDNIGIGQDSDGDGLPDELERARSDVRTTRQLLPVIVEDGGVAQSFVRRIDRSYAGQYALDSVVSHVGHDDLQIFIGLFDHIKNEDVRIKVYDRGIVTSPCQIPWWYYAYFSSGTGPAFTVEESSSGVHVSVDIMECFPFNAKTRSQLDWFLEVDDTSSDGDLAVIESLRVISAGQTSFKHADTDEDQARDGSEVNSRRDALGVDGDRDGVHEILDANDDIPNWMPSIKMWSLNYEEYVELEFLDLESPVIDVNVHAIRNRHVSANPLSLGSQGSMVFFKTPDDLPEGYRLSWRDAYGSSGHLDITMATSGAYRPSSLQGEYRDAAQTAVPLEATVLLPGAAGGLQIIGDLWTYLAAGSQYASRLAVGTAIRAASGVVFSVVLLAPGAGGGEYVQSQHSNVAVLSPLALATSNLCLSTSSFDAILVASETAIAQAAQGGVARTELEAAMANACPIGVNGDGAWRWIVERNGGVILLVTLGREVVESWRWDLPGPVRDYWGEKELMAKILLALAAQTGMELAEVLEHEYCLGRSCRANESPDSAQLEVWGDGMTTIQLQEISPGLPAVVLLPPGTVRGMEQRLEAIKSGQSAEGIALTEFAIGATTFATTEVLAKGGNRPSALEWYWTDGDSDDCAVNPNTRLCTDNAILKPTASEAYQSIGSGQDFLETGRIDWESPHLDTLAAKGIVSFEDQFTGDPGEDPTIAVLKKVWQSSQRGQPDKDADVAVSYDFHAHKHLRALTDFRETT